MRWLVVCCDGTWNTPEQVHGGVPTPTNVVRLHHALEEGPEQLRYYHPGVGTGPGLVDRLRGGGLGAGLEANIKSAYGWLAATWQEGDEICLFGFSRGAYTVRSLVGMIAACGLAPLPETLPSQRRWGEIDRLYDTVYRPGDASDRPATPPYPPVPVHFLGVWDTVGALGIPDALGPLQLLDVEARHRFHDTRLNRLVRHARHAVALDETRGPFTPTLWTEPAGPTAPTGGGPTGGGGAGGRTAQHEGEDRSIRQVWFPGNHGDVGGGHPQTGLSDGALQWMIDEARGCTGLAFRPHMLQQVRPDACDVLHDDCTGFYQHLSPTPRAVPLVDKAAADGALHASVLDRAARPPIAVGSYRSTQVLEPGEQAVLPVYANRPWNTTGLYLAPGDYALRAEGEWLDGRHAVAPDGTLEGRLLLPQVLHLASSFLGWWQERYRALSDDHAAVLFGAPRADGVPWMALVGVVAAQDLDAQGAQRPYRPFLIGTSTRLTVPAGGGGYLHAFANDAWGFYGNNKGSVTMTITRSVPPDAP